MSSQCLCQHVPKFHLQLSGLLWRASGLNYYLPHPPLTMSKVKIRENKGQAG